jgi:hypothetical protein
VNRIRPFYLYLLIVFLVLLLAYMTKKNVDAVHAPQSSHLSTPGSVSLFVPSPYELSMIVASRDIWPRRFGPRQVPTISDAPGIYSMYLSSFPAKRAEIDFFRSVAMATSLEEWDLLKELLSYRLGFSDTQKINPQTLLAWIKKEQCSIYGLEMAYRLVQWDMKKLKEVRDVFQSCDASSFHALWFDMHLALEDQKIESKKAQAGERLLAIRDKMQQVRERLGNDSFEYFLLTQTFSVLDLRLVHGS